MIRILILCFAFSASALAQGADTKAQSDRRVQLDQLLTALQAAPNDQAATLIEIRAQQLWLQSSSAAVELLLNRGLRELANDADGEAEVDFDAALALDPDFIEAWHRRAVARFEQGDSHGAIRDIQEALTREPRYFPGFDTLTRIAVARKDWKGAYAAWTQKLEIDPKCADGQEKLKDLRRRALGDDT
jgi:Tfp pilus assembly protein PilF